jgi:hypothetical protein
VHGKRCKVDGVQLIGSMFDRSECRMSRRRAKHLKACKRVKRHTVYCTRHPRHALEETQSMHQWR